MPERTYEIAPDGTSFKCLLCGMTSHHPKDVEHRFCGNCHVFHYPGGVLDYENKRVPPAIRRLMDEVANPTPRGVFDRSHNRHNRS